MRVSRFGIEISVEFTFREVDIKIQECCGRVKVRGVRFGSRTAHGACEFDSPMDTIEEVKERVNADSDREKT